MYIDIDTDADGNNRNDKHIIDKKDKHRIEILIFIYFACVFILTKNTESCKITLSKNLCQYDIIVIASLGTVFLEGLLGMLCRDGNILEKKLGLHTELDGWSIMHFLLYSTFGIFFPDRYFTFGLLSVAWESMEYYLGKYDVHLFNHCILKEGKMYGKISDITVNMVGYILGSYYATGKLNMTHILSEFR